MSSKAVEHYCTQCARSFARSEHLIRHTRTHTKEKPFHCGLCRQTFSRSDLLRRHTAKHHGTHQDSNVQPRTSPPDDLRVDGRQHDSQRVGEEQFPPSNEEARIVSGSPGNSSGMPIDDGIAVGVGNLAAETDNSEQWVIDHFHSVEQDSNFDGLITNGLSPSIPGWLLNFSSSAVDYDWDGPSFVAECPAPTNQGNEGQQSLLSRPSTPSHDTLLPLTSSKTQPAAAQAREFVITEQCLSRLQSDAAETIATPLPPRTVLSRYIRRYFRSFNCHQPLLHEATWDAETAPTPLVLAVCANGAVYELERATAHRLHDAANSIIKADSTGIWVLQTYMLCIALAAWEGTCSSILLAQRLQSCAIVSLRRQLAQRQLECKLSDSSWLAWVADESLKRVIVCLFTVSSLMSIAYELPSAIALEKKYSLPAHEVLWKATNKEDWAQTFTTYPIQHWQSFESVEEYLGDESLPLPSNIGVFGCHVIIVALLQRVIILRKSMSLADPYFERRREYLTLCLRRWQRMWEQEPEASLRPDDPQGPILFNSTALLRVTYVRLAADFSNIRSAFTFHEHAAEIESYVDAMPTPSRDSYATRAALQSALALRVPVKLGIKVVARTSFWIWSVQHALCYFECAIFLSKWLEAIHGAIDLDAEEHTVISVVQEVLRDVRVEQNLVTGPPLHVEILHSWSRLLDTADTTVWQLIPKLARVLELYAQRRSRA